MSDKYRRIGTITGTVRRQYLFTEEKVRIADGTLRPGQTGSAVAR